MRRGKGLELGKPGGPDGPPLDLDQVRQTAGYKFGYWGTLVVLWGLTILVGLAIGALIVHLAF